MALHETARALCDAYCARIDADHPGALAALYLVGSIALDDFRPGSSDVDFIAVLGRPLTTDQVTVLHSQIGQQFARPHFDGIYVDADALGEYERMIFPAHQAIIAEAIALRLGQHPAATPTERYMAMIDFLDTVITDGLACSA